MSASIRPGRRRLLAAGAGVVASGTLPGCASLFDPVGPVPQPDGSPRRHAQPVPFSAARPDGRLPPGWEPYVLRRDRRPTRYEAVEADGGTVLRARAERAASGVQCELDHDVDAGRRFLRWRWRADTLADGADVSADELDDAPLRVVLAFGGNVATLPLRERSFFELVRTFTGKELPYATLMYVWDAVLPVGTVVRVPRTTRIRYVVAESGTKSLGRWNDYRRDVADDYRRAFSGEAPGHVTAVGLLTDSDDLGGMAEGWYGDIAFVD